MSASFTHYVWTRSTSSGPQKLVLLALADHANKHGEAELSLRDMARLCGLSKTRIDEIIGSLVKLGEVSIIGQGTGRGKPKKYWITLRSVGHKCPDPFVPDEQEDKTPEPPATRTEKAPEKLLRPVQSVPVEKEQSPKFEVSQGDIDAVLKAAGIERDPSLPFFWHRQEHKTDLQKILEDTGSSVTAICQEIAEARGNGKMLARQPRRMSEIFKLSGRRIAS